MEHPPLFVRRRRRRCFFLRLGRRVLRRRRRRRVFRRRLPPPGAFCASIHAPSVIIISLILEKKGTAWAFCLSVSADKIFSSRRSIVGSYPPLRRRLLLLRRRPPLCDCPMVGVNCTFISYAACALPPKSAVFPAIDAVLAVAGPVS